MVAAFCGSTRRGSINRALLDRALELSREAGAEVDLIDLSEADLPLFNQDLENDEVTIKEMASGDQTTAPVDAFPGEREQPRYEDFA